MAEAGTEEKKSLGARIGSGLKTLAVETGKIAGAELGRAVDDIGNTYQACMWNGWHTQSAAVESPEYISEQLAKDEENKKLEAEKSGPTVGLEKD